MNCMKKSIATSTHYPTQNENTYEKIYLNINTDFLQTKVMPHEKYNLFNKLLYFSDYTLSTIEMRIVSTSVGGVKCFLKRYLR